MKTEEVCLIRSGTMNWNSFRLNVLKHHTRFCFPFFSQNYCSIILIIIMMFYLGFWQLFTSLSLLFVSVCVWLYNKNHIKKKEIVLLCAVKKEFKITFNCVISLNDFVIVSLFLLVFLHHLILITSVINPSSCHLHWTLATCLSVVITGLLSGNWWFNYRSDQIDNTVISSDSVTWCVNKLCNRFFCSWTNINEEWNSTAVNCISFGSGWELV